MKKDFPNSCAKIKLNFKNPTNCIQIPILKILNSKVVFIGKSKDGL
jgi:hypothetical protein